MLIARITELLLVRNGPSYVTSVTCSLYFTQAFLCFAPSHLLPQNLARSFAKRFISSPRGVRSIVSFEIVFSANNSLSL